MRKTMSTIVVLLLIGSVFGAASFEIVSNVKIFKVLSPTSNIFSNNKPIQIQDPLVSFFSNAKTIFIPRLGSFTSNFKDIHIQSEISILKSNLKNLFVHSVISGLASNRISIEVISLPADFEISVSPESQSIGRSESVQYQITVTSINGFSSLVSFEAYESPDADLTYVFNPSIVTPPPDGTVQSTLTVSTTSVTPLKTFRIMITAMGEGKIHSKEVKLYVRILLNVPYQSQDGATWCAPTSLAMVLRYYGIATHSWNIAEYLSQDKNKGAFFGPDLYGHNLIPRLSDYLDRYYSQYEIKYYTETTTQIFADIEYYISLKEPVILSIKNPSNPQEKHAIVIIGYNETGYFFHDPSYPGFVTSTYAPSYVTSIPLGFGTHGYITKEGIISHNFDIICTDFTDILGLEKANTGTLLILKGIPSPISGGLEVFSHPTDYFDPKSSSVYFDQLWPIYLDLDRGLTWKQALLSVGYPVLGPQDTMKCKIRIYNHELVTQTFTVMFSIKGSDGITYYLDVELKRIDALAGSYYEQSILLNDHLTKTQYYSIQVTLLDAEGNGIDTISFPEIYYFNKGELIKLEEIQYHLYLHVYDDQGNHIGIDYLTNQTEIGIPDSYYYDNGNGTITIIVPIPLNLTVIVDAKYAVDIVESYDFTVVLKTEIVETSQTYSSNITKGESQTFRVKISETTLYVWPVITSTIDIHPEVLNLKSKGKWITTYIELPKGYNVSEINISSILLNDTISVELNAPIIIGDYDNDSIPDLMVKFNRTAVSEFILSKGIMMGNVTLTVTGQLINGVLFEGSDIIKVRMPGDINMDGKVDLKDIAIAAISFGSYLGHPKWNPIANENEDNKIDMRDFALIAKNFGKSTYSDTKIFKFH